MYPIRFEPIYQDYVWGGSRIAKKFHRKIDQPRVAESWELADRDDGMSRVLNGSFKGKTLHQLVVELGEKLLGVGQKWERFPLVLKIIDAKENLSIQVHPDEGSAPDLKGAAKTEMWVILEESAVYAGLKKGTTEKEFLKAIQDNRPAEFLEKIELKKAEAVFIPGGRVHAICGGSLLYEVQQNSSSTYRLYDWGRTTRPLHLKEGLSAIDWNDHHPAKLTPRRISSDFHHQLISLVAAPCFAVERIDVFDHLHVASIPKTFQVFFCMEGEGHISVDSYKEPFQPGMTYLVPAAGKSIEIEGKCQTLRIRLS